MENSQGSNDWENKKDLYKHYVCIYIYVYAYIYLYYTILYYAMLYYIILYYTLSSLWPAVLIKFGSCHSDLKPQSPPVTTYPVYKAFL